MSIFSSSLTAVSAGVDKDLGGVGRRVQLPKCTLGHFAKHAGLCNTPKNSNTAKNLVKQDI